MCICSRYKVRLPGNKSVFQPQAKRQHYATAPEVNHRVLGMIGATLRLVGAIASMNWSRFVTVPSKCQSPSLPSLSLPFVSATPSCKGSTRWWVFFGRFQLVETGPPWVRSTVCEIHVAWSRPCVIVDVEARRWSHLMPCLYCRGKSWQIASGRFQLAS